MFHFSLIKVANSRFNIYLNTKRYININQLNLPCQHIFVTIGILIKSKVEICRMKLKKCVGVLEFLI